MYAISKINRQHEQTWINLQKRINEVQFSHKKLFPDDDVYSFIKNHAVSVGSSECYFVPSLLATTAYLLAVNDARVHASTHKQPLNIYTIFVGYPGTGKSSAIQYAAQDPLESLDMTATTISKSTSSGLIKTIAANGKGFILSPEIYDILHKLLKSDEENATGDVQLLCKLFSGERSSYHYSTEQTRVIPANTPFGMLGSTQLVNAAKLIAMMDHGHGLVDRFLIATPYTQRPTLTEMDAAKAYLTTEVVEDYTELFQRINSSEVREFYFDDGGKAFLRDLIDQFVSEVNEAIREGKVPPKSKTPELVPRVAAALHVFNHVLKELLAGNPQNAPPTKISRATLQNAASYVHHLESQKDILCQITNGACERTIEQPTIQDIKDTVILTQGPVVTYRSFKHSKRTARCIAQPEYSRAVQALEEDGLGRSIEFRIPRSRGPCKVFIKSSPTEWPNNTTLSR